MSVQFTQITPVEPFAEHTSALRMAVIGNYPPRRCGIATFTADMVSCLHEAAPQVAIEVYAMVPGPDTALPDGVAWQIDEHNRAEHVLAGRMIDASGVDLVWVQHEFGIFGGDAGEWLIDMLEPVAAPLVVTLHTVLEQPDAAQERVLAWLIARASRLVVMSRTAARMLCRRGDVSRDQIVMVEHGVPDRPFGQEVAMKRKLGLPGGPVLLTFGLLSPGKGIEVAIRALARVVPEHPDVTYVVAGVTHPNLAAREGEAYRHQLQQLAAELGIEDRIRWIDEYLDLDDLVDLLEAADIYLTPYIAAGQSTSGTLSYAVALGNAVISTPYSHAVELLADGIGLLTGFGDEAAMAEAISELLADPDQLLTLQRRAYERGRSMIWSQFAHRTLEVIEQLRIERIELPPPACIAEDDLERLCDDTGMIQHSVLGVPDRDHGYCVDDNARALILAHLSGGRFARRATSFAAFIQHSWNPTMNRFRNFMGYDRAWCETMGSEDSCARALWAIGLTASQGASADLRRWGRHLWRQAAGMALEFHSPRAVAFAMLGAEGLLQACPGDEAGSAIMERGAVLLADGLRHYSEPGWTWFEPALAYDNCRLPQALLVAARRAGNHAQAGDALAALGWIFDRQTSGAGHFRPIGSESFGLRERPWLPFDQQPVDAWASVDAAVLAFRHTGATRWRRAAELAYAWFFGHNDRGVVLADGATGACHDGLGPRGANSNRGAESVLSLHLAAHALSMLQPSHAKMADAGSVAAISRGAVPPSD